MGEKRSWLNFWLVVAAFAVGAIFVGFMSTPIRVTIYAVVGVSIIGMLLFDSWRHRHDR